MYYEAILKIHLYVLNISNKKKAYLVPYSDNKKVIEFKKTSV